MSSPTVAILVIGDEILSGRTRDENMYHLAGVLTAHGIDLSEVRIVPDNRTAIVAAVNALRAAFDHPSLPAASARPMMTSRPTRSLLRSGCRSWSMTRPTGGSGPSAWCDIAHGRARARTHLAARWFAWLAKPSLVFVSSG